MSCLLACICRAMDATTSITGPWLGARSHKQEKQDRTWSPKGPMAQPHLHAVMPARSERGPGRRRRSCTAFTKKAGSMAPWPIVGTALKANMEPC